MPPDLTAGMVLVGSVASGTASNVMIYLARGDVALSVTISALSTLVGVFATPLLTRLYVDASIAVDVHGMLMSILQIVALPIVAGGRVLQSSPDQPPALARAHTPVSCFPMPRVPQRALVLILTI